MRIPVLAAVLLWILTLAADFYIFHDIRRCSSPKRRKTWMWIYGVSALMCWAWLVVIMCIPRRSADQSILPLMWMLFAYLSVYAAKIGYCICSAIGKPFVRLSSKNRNYGSWAGALAAMAIFAGLWWGAGPGREEIDVSRVEVSSRKLPQAFDGLRVVQFSDAHVGTWGTDTAFISKMVDTINSLDPDLILFTGDIVNRRSAELDPFTNVFSRLRARKGVFAVHGNHDYASYTDWKTPGDSASDVGRLDSLMTSMGWRVLNNRAVFLTEGADSIALIGVENWGEPPFNQLGRLEVVYGLDDRGRHGLDDGMFKILMTHNPAHWEEVVTEISNIDLTLSGHTHAMQFAVGPVTRKWSPAAWRYKEWGGLYRRKAKDGKDMNLYVNIGCGEVGFPARIGSAHPEVTLFTLCKTPR